MNYFVQGIGLFIIITHVEPVNDALKIENILIFAI
jgi:hypothetical protein